ncbi:MAG: hypothetical protein HYY16_08780 [Planctomycetes bacterium]|nr:hypothetical protein [Planctomycetota bacterium]
MALVRRAVHILGLRPSAVALEDIDRIEIIRGPGSFLYGPNAMHGTVNIITKRARDIVPEGEEAHLRTSATLDSYLTNIATVQSSFWDREHACGGRLTLGWNDIGDFVERDVHDKKMGFGTLIADKDFSDGSNLEIHAGGHNGKYKTHRTVPLFVEMERS